MDALGSAMLSAASAAEEVTVAVVGGRVVLAQAGHEGPNVAGVPSTRLSVRRDAAQTPPWCWSAWMTV